MKLVMITYKRWYKKDQTNDFEGILECPFCRHKVALHNGYLDARFLLDVLPTCTCPKCKRQEIEGEDRTTERNFEGGFKEYMSGWRKQVIGVKSVRNIVLNSIEELLHKLPKEEWYAPFYEEFKKRLEASK